MTARQEDPPPALTEDLFLGGKLRILQPEKGYRAGIDPILLAAAVPARNGQKIAELGCGVGTAALALITRMIMQGEQPASLTGVELDPEMVSIARRNAALNGYERIFRVLNADLAKLPPMVEPVSFDHVFLNPPYLEPTKHRLSPDTAASHARFEGEVTLTQWVEKAMRLLRPKGQLTMIHRADRLSDILGALEGRAGAIELFPLWPGNGEAAKIMLIKTCKDSRAPLALLPGLTLHGSNGEFTDEAEAVLRHGKPLHFRERFAC